jgi:hypothetical protein
MFEIGRTKQNKPCIIINPNKYRKDKVLANKDITWRCMGTGCNASVRTDASASTILQHRDTHTGEHSPTALVPLTVAGPTAGACGSVTDSERALNGSPSRGARSPSAPGSCSRTPLSTGADSFGPDESLSLQDLVVRMRTTIEVLEADNSALREENGSLQNELRDLRNFYSPGLICSDRTTPTTVSQENLFNVLTAEDVTPLVMEGSASVRGVVGRMRRRASRGRRRVLVMADSHGKELGPLLNSELSDSFDTTVIARSGATFDGVTKDITNFAKDFNARDHIIIIGGTNDVIDRKDQPCAMDLEPIKKLSRQTNITVASIPFRYDRPLMNSNVHYLNNWMRNKLYDTKNVKILDLSDFNVSDYTSHGLHFNKRNGKRKLVRMISDLLGQKKDLVPGHFTNEFVNFTNCYNNTVVDICIPNVCENINHNSKNGDKSQNVCKNTNEACDERTNEHNKKFRSTLMINLSYSSGEEKVGKLENEKIGKNIYNIVDISDERNDSSEYINTSIVHETDSEGSFL